MTKLTLNIGIPGNLIEKVDGSTVVAEPWFWRQGYNLDSNPYFHLNGWTVERFKSQGIVFPVLEEEAQKIEMPDSVSNLFDFCQTYRECDWHEVHYKYNRKHYKDFINANIPFIILIPFGSPFSRKNIEKMYLPEDLIQAIHRKLCKVVFSCCTEGYPFIEDFWWFKVFCKKFNFTEEDFAIFSANLKLTGDILKRKLPYSVYEDSIFETDPWFSLDVDRSILPDKTFTCLNRRFTQDRLAMVSWLSNHYNNESYLSLSKDSVESVVTPDLGYLGLLSPEIITEIAHYGLTSSGNENGVFRSLDDPDITQQTNHAGDLSEYILKGAVNIVVETMPFDSRTLFISEKTWKPVAACRPFVIFGNCGTLRKLRKLGYKTFGKWWDESYDEIKDPNERLKACWQTLDQIGQKPFDKILKMS